MIEGDSAYTFGGPATYEEPAVTLRVVNANFWCRIYASHDLGCKPCLAHLSGSHADLCQSVAEAYMHGDFSATPSDVKAVLNVSNGTPTSHAQPDLRHFIQLWLQNRQNLSALTSLLSRSASFLSALYVRAFGQSLQNAKLNVVRHAPRPGSRTSLNAPADHRLRRVQRLLQGACAPHAFCPDKSNVETLAPERPCSERR